MLPLLQNKQLYKNRLYILTITTMAKTIEEEIINYLNENDMYFVEEYDKKTDFLLMMKQMI